MINLSFDFNLFNNYYYFYERLLVLIFSLVPTLLLVAFVLYTDRKSREPVKNVVLCLLSGILTISVAGYFENLVMPYFSNNTILTFVWAFIEELSKIAIFFLFIFDNKHYDDIYDGIVYMMLIALSFAGLENIMYAFSESTINDSISLALMRDFTTVPLHVICGIVIGYFMSLGSFSKSKDKKIINFSLAIVVPSLIHGSFNFLMNFLGNLKIDYNNSIQVLLFEILPLLVIMISLFYLAAKVSKKALSLNKTFINNEQYDKKHNYLMTNEEYLYSSIRTRRIKMYQKTSLSRNKEEDDVYDKKISS
mgnify:FL=1